MNSLKLLRINYTEYYVDNFHDNSKRYLGQILCGGIKIVCGQIT